MNKYKDAVPAVAVTVAAASCITEAKNIGLSGNGSSQGSSWLCNGSSSSCCTAIEHQLQLLYKNRQPDLLL